VNMEEGPNRVFLTQREQENKDACKIHTFLDSGAGENMFKTRDVFTKIGEKKSTLLTACTDAKSSAVQGQMKGLKYDKTNIDVNLDTKNRAIFCDQLNENLVSVGKMCENKQVIVFDQHEYVIFKGKVSIQGEVVYAEGRDPQTGLYPLTLTTEIGPQIDKKHDMFTDVNELRSVCHTFQVWAQKINEDKKTYFTDEEQRVDNRERIYEANLARQYVKEGTTDMERWHNKLGHVGTKIIKHCQIENLKIPKLPFRCEHCIKGKMHSGNHSSKSTNRKTDLKSGEYIITDLQGPYVRNRNGEKYSQIFLDVVSKKVWLVRLKKKNESDEAIKKVLLDARTRSRNKIRILRTDGDGIFGRSETFKKLKEKEEFVHERPPPYDHQQSAIIDRECRTLLEGVNTALDQSGAPPNFWGEAADHFIFTRNTLPRVEIGNKESKEGVQHKSPNTVLENRKVEFNLKHLVAFGTQVTSIVEREEKHQDRKNRMMVLC